MEGKKKKGHELQDSSAVFLVSGSKQQHLFVLAACGNVLLLLMFLRLT